jgi:hypothetical protein
VEISKRYPVLSFALNIYLFIFSCATVMRASNARRHVRNAALKIAYK